MLTGGSSSFSDSVRSGFAERFAKTPSDPTPPPTTRGLESDNVFDCVEFDKGRDDP